MIDWKVARIGTEIGIACFWRFDADDYPLGYIDRAKWYQDEILAAIDRFARSTRDSDMSVAAEALDEHWRTAEWERQS